MDYDKEMERFLKRVEKTDNCWNWTGCLVRGGYGQTYVQGKKKYAHRHSYELFVAPIPGVLTVDHICFNRKCVNPEHLQLLTLADNVRRSQINLDRASGKRLSIPPAHSRNRYRNWFCRCDVCKEANTAYHRLYRKRNKINRP